MYYFVQTKGVVPYGYDENNYIECAKRIIETGRFSFWGIEPDAYTTPAFPLFLAFNFKIFGSSQSGIVAVRFIQAILTSLGCFFACTTSYEITQKDIATITTGIFLSVNATIAYYSTYLLTEPLCFFFTTLFIYLFVLYMKNGGEWIALSAGVAYALAIETRPPIAVLIPVFAIIMWKKSSTKEKLLFFGGLLIVILPWTIRNAIVLKKFVLFCTQTNAFFYGFCPDPLAYGLTAPDSILGNLKYVVEFFKADPLGELKYMTVDKFKAIFLSYDEICGLRTRLPELDIMIRISFVLTGFLGVLFGLFSKKYRKISITMLIFLACTFLVIPTVRYGFPFYPMLGMFTGLVLDALYKQFNLS